ncbi:hypothetical protein ES703_81158 [subsurface metagenome]
MGLGDDIRDMIGNLKGVGPAFAEVFSDYRPEFLYLH